jgi:hypothetical protein
MRDDNQLTGTQVQSERGTVYVVSVSGPKMYPTGPMHWMVQRGEGIQLYQLLRVDGDVLKYESRTASGDLFDAFELHKQPGGGNILVESDSPLLRTRGPAGRQYWNAAGGVLILAVVIFGIVWAVRSRAA